MRKRWLWIGAVAIMVSFIFVMCSRILGGKEVDGGVVMTEPQQTVLPEKITEYLRSSEVVDASVVEALSKQEPALNTYSSLCVPTYITKVEDTYFLVDCYHNQVIYHDDLTSPLTDWKVMTTDMNKGHTLASDGEVYLIDDTENHRILVFEKKEDKFIHTQTFSDMGNRPHYIIYDERTATFYAWSSLTGEMFLLRRNPEDAKMYLTEIRKVDALDGVYVRSFTIIEDKIYFVSGNSNIICADLETFEILDTYPVPDSLAGMIQLTKIQDYYYITVSTDIAGNQDYATMIRTKKLSGLKKRKYEEVYHHFVGGGTPYYITEFDNAYYLTEHRLPGHSVWSFQVIDNEIVSVESVY